MSETTATAEYDKKSANTINPNDLSKNTAVKSPTTNQQQQRDHFESNFSFLQLKNFGNFFPTKTTCTTIYEKFTNKLSNGINNYQCVIKNGMSREKASNTPNTDNIDNIDKNIDNNIDNNIGNFISNNIDNTKTNSLSLNLNLSNISKSSNSLNNSTNSNNSNNLNLNRNINVRRSLKSNLGLSNELNQQQQSNKMIREQLSPNVNALSPKLPRPKDFGMQVSSLVSESQRHPIGTLNTTLNSRNNYMKIDGKDYAIDECDFVLLDQLGVGACGTVNKMEHIKSKAIVAVKEMTRSSHPEDNKRINMDLEVLLKCDNEHIVKCYGYFMKGIRVWIIMELMTTCLDKLLKKINAPFPENICGKIAVASIKSLDYLKEKHSVIHRDIKPSNILINLEGEIKLCDFGISGRLVDSIAKTKQGCNAYMAPERIQPPDPNRPSYDIRADVWSLGISLVQLALGKYPYTNCESHFELLTKIIESEPPLLPEDDSSFSNFFKDFIKQCLQKDVKKRPKYKYLMYEPFYMKYDRENVDIKSWFNRIYYQN